MAIVDGKIRCSRCREFKDLAAYPPSVVRKGCGECRVCARARGRAFGVTPRARELQNAWRAKNREKVNAQDLQRYHRQKASGRPENTRLKTRYGITLAEFNVMRDAQAGRCACCGDMLDGEIDAAGRRKLYVDHDHITGVVRGLLCHGCNSGIGHFKDDPQRMRNAIAYLERAQQQAPHRTTPSMRINLLPGVN